MWQAILELYLTSHSQFVLFVCDGLLQRKIKRKNSWTCSDFKGPPSTDRHCKPWNNFHMWKSHQSWNSSNQIALISNVNFHNKNNRLKSLSVEGGLSIKCPKWPKNQEFIYFSQSLREVSRRATTLATQFNKTVNYSFASHSQSVNTPWKISEQWKFIR